MQKVLIIIFVFSWCGSLHAQFTPDTIFYTSRWQPTHIMDSVTYYRVAEKAGDLYVVTDYYKSTGIVQMKGTCLSLHPDIKHGAFSYYRPDGKLENERNYRNDTVQGKVTWYYPNGTIETTGSFLNGKRHGEWKWFTELGQLRIVETYENGLLHGVTQSFTPETGKLNFQHYYTQGKLNRTPSYEDDVQSGLLVRGKAAGFVIIEDIWVLNVTAGLEYRFGENHAFGIDYYFFRWRFEQEQYVNATTYNEYSEYNPRHSVLVDYRYYFDADLSRRRSVKPYFQLYGRFGKAKIYHDPEYNIDSGGIYRQWENFYDVGATFGIHYGFLPHGRFGFDICAGAFYRTLTEDIERYQPGGNNWFENDVTRSKWMALVRVNLYYHLFGKKLKSDSNLSIDK